MQRKRARTLMTRGLSYAIVLTIAAIISACAQITRSSAEEPNDFSEFTNFEDTCPNQPGSNGCWTTPSNRPDCYLWTIDYQQDRKMEWNGSCSAGFAHGVGIVTWYDAGRPGEVVTYKRRKKLGVKTAQKSVSLDPDAWTAQGEFKDGRKEGFWRETRGFGVKMTGCYEKGLRTGQWREIHDGKSKSEGPYLRGKRHGLWVHIHEDGEVWEGRYLDGSKHGEWLAFERGRNTKRLIFMDGKLELD